LADKGSIRAGNVRRRRASAVAALFEQTPPFEVEMVEDEAAATFQL
jgi:hypothetical protein